MELIHPLDAKEVLEHMSLAAERQLLKETAMKFVQEDVQALVQQREQNGKREGKLEATYDLLLKCHAEGLDRALMSKLTGFSLEHIESFFANKGLT